MKQEILARRAAIAIAAASFWAFLPALAGKELSVSPTALAASQQDSGSAQNSSANEEDEAPKERFAYLFSDESYKYYLDTESARYTTPPSSAEKIIEVWIKMESVEEPDAAYSYPPKYFLEHYLFDPKRRRAQFLSELEVQGRPDNDIKERPYSPHNWENLVPGSLEDGIFRALMKNKKHIKRANNEDGWTSSRNFIEETFRISL